MEIKETFLTDKPISNEQDDKFQRYNFSKRIAAIIAHQKNPDSMIIGLYGAWGEGKTSVLNFIKAELKKIDTSILYFSFNPWRFSDESTILFSFFNILADTLQKSLNNTCIEDKSKKENWWRKKKDH